MRNTRVYSLLAWVTLFAFAGMMIVKDTHHHHHHHVHASCETVCVLDGELLSAHHPHQHKSFLPLHVEDDHCAICQFHVVKVEKASFVTYISPLRTVVRIAAAPAEKIGSVLFSVLSTRAPPAE
ncbi:MAG: hypothetical protein K6A36_01925 [Paludibacteraceae bacterium]|nr:hypothetical protein [Paludibacteraceae bacterium]